jgi:hypothetical protein
LIDRRGALPLLSARAGVAGARRRRITSANAAALMATAAQSFQFNNIAATTAGFIAKGGV